MDRLFPGLPEDKRWIAEDLEKFIAKFTKLQNASEIKPANWGKYRFMPYFDPETAKRAYKETDLYKNAVIIVSFPRTGTNWTMEIVRQILYGEDETLNKISKAIPPFAMTILETWRPEKFDLVKHMPLPRKIFYSHLPVELMNLETIKKYNGKVILLNRNPKDQVVSWYHFNRQISLNISHDIYPADWNEFFADFIAGNQWTMMPEGEFYPEFLRDWYKHKDDENLMVLTYENLKKNYEAEIKNIAKFLGVEISDERAAEIAKATSFNSMKETQDTRNADTEKYQDHFQMFRRGKVGGWKDLFTVAQSEQMDQIIEERLGDSKIKFIYE